MTDGPKEEPLLLRLPLYPALSHLRPFCHPEKGETQQTASEAGEPSEAKPYKAILMLIACS